MNSLLPDPADPAFKSVNLFLYGLGKAYGATIAPAIQDALDHDVPRALEVVGEEVHTALARAFASHAVNRPDTDQHLDRLVDVMLAEQSEVTDETRHTLRTYLYAWYVDQHVELEGALVPKRLEDALAHTLGLRKASPLPYEVMDVGSWLGLPLYPELQQRILDVAARIGQPSYRRAALRALRPFIEDAASAQSTLDPALVSHVREAVQALMQVNGGHEEMSGDAWLFYRDTQHLAEEVLQSTATDLAIPWTLLNSGLELTGRAYAAGLGPQLAEMTRLLSPAEGIGTVRADMSTDGTTTQVVVQITSRDPSMRGRQYRVALRVHHVDQPDPFVIDGYIVLVGSRWIDGRCTLVVEVPLREIGEVQLFLHPQDSNA